MCKSVFGIVAASLVCSYWSLLNVASAQQPSLRYNGGWSTSSRPVPSTAPLSPSQPTTSSPVVQAAFNQPPSSGLPTYPSANTPASNGNGFSASGVMPPTLPPMPNTFQTAQPTLPPVGLNNYSSNTPAPIPQYNQSSNQPLPNQQLTNQQYSNQQPFFDPYSTQPSQVLPPNNPNRAVPTGDNLRAVQNSGQSAYDPNGGLRPVAPTMPGGFGPNARPIDIATGYPFVSPAPRTGNYPTSAYNSSLFQTVSHQNAVQAPNRPAPNSVNVANVANTQPTLPQFQNAPVTGGPGVYPTQNQCAPGTAVYPPAGAVPGSYIPPTVTPNMAPGSYSANNSGYSPMLSLGQENYNVQMGRGIIGQPTVYVPSQPFRNFFRYLAP